MQKLNSFKNSSNLLELKLAMNSDVIDKSFVDSKFPKERFFAPGNFPRHVSYLALPIKVPKI